MEEFAFLVMILSLHSAAVCYERFYVPQATFFVRQTLNPEEAEAVPGGLWSTCWNGILSTLFLLFCCCISVPLIKIGSSSIVF